MLRSNHHARSGAPPIRRVEPVRAKHLTELTLEYWPSSHLVSILSSLELPNIRSFRSSIDPYHEPRTFTWMDSAPLSLQNLGMRCRSAHCSYEDRGVEIACYLSEEWPASSVKPPLAYTHTWAEEKSTAMQTPNGDLRHDVRLDHLSSTMPFGFCTTVIVNGEGNRAVGSGYALRSSLPLINLFKNVKFLRIEEPLVFHFCEHIHAIHNEIWDSLNSLELVLSKFSYAGQRPDLSRLVQTLDWKFGTIRRRKFGAVRIIFDCSRFCEEITAQFLPKLQDLVDCVEIRLVDL